MSPPAARKGSGWSGGVGELGREEGAESEECTLDARLPPTLCRNKCPQRPRAEAPFLLRREKPLPRQGRVEAPGARDAGVGPSAPSRGGGEGAEQRQGEVAMYPTTPSSSPLKTSDLGPKGDRPRDREETQKASRGAVRCAALPERCGARAALRCTPPRHRLPEAAEGARFISAKVLLLLFCVQRTSLCTGGRRGVSPGVGGARSPPRLHGLTRQGQAAHVWVPTASFPEDRGGRGLAPAS